MTPVAIFHSAEAVARKRRRVRLQMRWRWVVRPARSQRSGSGTGGAGRPDQSPTDLHHVPGRAEKFVARPAVDDDLPRLQRGVHRRGHWLRTPAGVGGSRSGGRRRSPVMVRLPNPRPEIEDDPNFRDVPASVSVRRRAFCLLMLPSTIPSARGPPINCPNVRFNSAPRSVIRPVTRGADVLTGVT